MHNTISRGEDIQFVAPTQEPGVILQRVGREGILYDRLHGRAHVINASAALVWSLCDGQATVDAIVSAVADAYELPISTVHNDVVSIITTFHKLGLLK